MLQSVPVLRARLEVGASSGPAVHRMLRRRNLLRYSRTADEAPGAGSRARELECVRHHRGVSADWVAAVGQVAGAVGTVAAVLAAVLIASREGRRWRRDDERRAVAQARLVVVADPETTTFTRHSDGLRETGYSVQVENLSDRAVFDVWGQGTFHTTEQGHTSSWDATSTSNEYTRYLRVHDYLHLHAVVICELKAPQLVGWRVGWTDADGRRWCVAWRRAERRTMVEIRRPRRRSQR